MSDSQKRILEMLAEKKISVDEASRLLGAIGQPAGSGSHSSDRAQTGRQRPKYLRVVVQPNADVVGAEVEHVNIRVPLALIHAGVKLTALIPSHAAGQVTDALKDKGIDLDLRNLKPEDLEQFMDALGELEVDVRNGREKVRVYVE